MTPNEICRDLKNRFTWESDGKLDSYHILKGDGKVKGDCDDYAVTILYNYCGGSYLKFWWLLVTFQAVFWFVKSPNDGPHVTLWLRGHGYTDNWKTQFTTKELLHDKRYPIPWPTVMVKLLIGKFDKT